MKRRTVLAAVGSLSAAAPAVASARDSDGDGDDKNGHDCETIEIPVAKSGEEVVATEEVPEEWWDHVERSREVADELGDKLEDEPWFEGISRSTGEAEICGSSVFVVTVHASDADAARSRLAESRDGVPIEIGEPLPDAVPTDGAAAGGDEPDEIETESGNGDGDGATASNETNAAAASADDDSMPGFGIVGGLAGLGAAGYLFSSRERDGERSSRFDR